MSKLFAVFAEVRDGKLRKVTLEALQAALTAKNEADRLVAVLMGEQVSSLRDELARYHIGQVHVMDHPDLKQYNPEIYFAALSEWMDRWKPDAVFLGHTAIGRDLAPMISAHMNAGQISDIISVEKAGSYFCFTRPLYAGKAFEKKQCLDFPIVVTVRPNNIPLAEVTASQAEIVQVNYSSPGSLRTVVKDVVRKTSGKVDLAEARIVVSGGRPKY